MKIKWIFVDSLACAATEFFPRRGSLPQAPITEVVTLFTKFITFEAQS
jgi:hypothetical protein